MSFIQIKSLTRKTWKWLGILAAAIGVISAFFWLFDTVAEAVKTPEEKFFEEKFVQGVTIPMTVQKKYGKIYVDLGNETREITIDELKVRNGANLVYGMFQDKAHCADVGFSFLLKGEKLFLLKKFYALDHTYIGELKENVWRAKKSEIDFYKAPSEDGSNLELIDNKDNVLFNMRYTYPNTITVRGYFVTEHIDCVTVITDKGVVGDDLSKATGNIYKDIKENKKLNKY